MNVATAGVYNFDYRVASSGSVGGNFHMEVDGVNVTGTLQVPNTGSWSTYQTVTKTGVNLTAGFHLVKIVFDTSGPNGFSGNFNWFRATNATPLAAVSMASSAWRVSVAKYARAASEL